MRERGEECRTGFALPRSLALVGACIVDGFYLYSFGVSDVDHYFDLLGRCLDTLPELFEYNLFFPKSLQLNLAKPQRQICLPSLSNIVNRLSKTKVN